MGQGPSPGNNPPVGQGTAPGNNPPVGQGPSPGNNPPWSQGLARQHPPVGQGTAPATTLPWVRAPAPATTLPWVRATSLTTASAALPAARKIVARLEEGNLTLEESLGLYEEGMKLARHCQELLQGAELRITKLQESFAETLGAVRDEPEEYELAEDPPGADDEPALE